MPLAYARCKGSCQRALESSSSSGIGTARASKPRNPAAILHDDAQSHDHDQSPLVLFSSREQVWTSSSSLSAPGSASPSAAESSPDWRALQTQEDGRDKFFQSKFEGIILAKSAKLSSDWLSQLGKRVAARTSSASWRAHQSKISSSKNSGSTHAVVVHLAHASR